MLFKMVLWTLFFGCSAFSNYSFENDSLSRIQFESSLMFLFRDELGDTLIGEKPMSVNNCQNFNLIHNKEIAESVFNFLRKAFQNSKTYIFKIIYVCPGFTQVQLIHKPSLSRLIKKNRRLQNFISETYGSERIFFQKLNDVQTSVFECFKNNEQILGLVFGYGKTNTEYYLRYNLVGLYLKKYPRVDSLCFNPKPRLNMIIKHQRKIRFNFEERKSPPKPLPRFKSLEEEWEWIRDVRFLPSKDMLPTIPYLFCLPTFIMRKGVGAEKVRRKLMRARNRLAQLFSGKKFSSVIVEYTKLAENDHRREIAYD